MPPAIIDQNDLVLPLFAGLFGPAPWDLFLQRLRARTRAQRVRLVIRHGEGTNLLHRRAAIAGDAGGSAAETDAVLALIARPGWRPNRVYALDEWPETADAPALAEARIGDARLLRIDAAGGHTLWLVLLDERPAFTAADSALLSALIPAVTVAMATLATLIPLRRHLAAAEETLARLGITQALLDRAGEVVAGATPAFADHRAALSAACARLAGSPPGNMELQVPGREGGEWVMLRAVASAEAALPTRGEVAAIRRQARLPDAAAMQPVIAAHFHLSRQEARLAALLACGQPLAEAGEKMGLTRETARSYAKKIYSKTGTSGQLELATRILCTLAPLA